MVREDQSLVPLGSQSPTTDAQERATSETVLTSRGSDTTLRLYAIVRGDLEMPPGKMAAQAGHAFVEALRAAESPLAGEDANSEWRRYVNDPPGTKVVLVARDELALLRLHAEAQERGIPSAVIYDSGHVLPPHFDGSPILTAVGLGPTIRRKAAPLTRRFALVP